MARWTWLLSARSGPSKVFDRGLLSGQNPRYTDARYPEILINVVSIMAKPFTFDDRRLLIWLGLVLAAGSVASFRFGFDELFFLVGFGLLAMGAPIKSRPGALLREYPAPSKLGGSISATGVAVFASPVAAHVVKWMMGHLQA